MHGKVEATKHTVPQSVLKKIVAAVLCLAFLFPGIAMAGKNAKENDALEKEREEELVLEELVVTGTRFSVPKTSFPGRIDVIDSEQISQLPYENVDDLLNWVSGVQSSRTGGIYELSPRVTMRGLGGNMPARTLVLIDGVPATIGDSGNMRWNRVNTADIERIETFKGPGSSIYGSNAMGGVINIITRQPKEGFTGKVSGGYGTHDTKKGSALLGMRSEGKTGWYGQIAATGLDSSGYKHLTADSSHYDARIDRFVEEFTINTKLGYVFDHQNTLELNHSYFDDRRGEGYKYNIDRGSHREFDTNALNIRYDGGFDDWQWNLSGYYQKEAYFWHRDFERESSIFRVNSDRVDYGAFGSLAKDIGDYNTLTVGMDARFSSVDATDDYDFTDEYADNKGELDQYAVYGQNEMRLMQEQLVLMAGLRYDTARFHSGFYDSNVPPFDEVSGSMPSNSWNAVSPRMAARYFFTPDLSLFGSYSRGFRAPILDATSRYGIFRGRFYDANPELENETLDSFEIGLDARPLEEFSLSASAFYSLGKDFIYSVDTGEERFLWGRDRSVFRMENVTEVEIFGLELDVNYRLSDMFKLFANYTYNDSKIEKFSERPDLESKRLEYVPRHQASLGATFLHHLANISVTVNHTGSQYTDDMNENKISSYETVNAKLWKELERVYPGLGIAVKADNLLDERFLRSEDTKSPGRTIFGEISYKW